MITRTYDAHKQATEYVREDRFHVSDRLIYTDEKLADLVQHYDFEAKFDEIMARTKALTNARFIQVTDGPNLGDVVRVAEGDARVTYDGVTYRVDGDKLVALDESEKNVEQRSQPTE